MCVCVCVCVCNIEFDQLEILKHLNINFYLVCLECKFKE